MHRLVDGLVYAFKALIVLRFEWHMLRILLKLPRLMDMSSIIKYTTCDNNHFEIKISHQMQQFQSSSTIKIRVMEFTAVKTNGFTRNVSDLHTFCCQCKCTTICEKCILKTMQNMRYPSSICIYSSAIDVVHKNQQQITTTF